MQEPYVTPGIWVLAIRGLRFRVSGSNVWGFGFGVY